MLDSSNHLCQIFRKARDQYETAGAKEFTIRPVANQGKGRQYDMPNTNEVAGLIVGDLSTTTGYKDYPLLFPYGEYGFHTEIPYVVAEGRQRKKSFISIREYYAYQIQTRLKEGKTIIKSGRLLHQYVVDAYTAIEAERLRWNKNNQEQLRADLYNNVCDAVCKGDTDARVHGKRVILPSSFTGSPRYMIEKYAHLVGWCIKNSNNK
ncbi:unnamed protein product [Brassica napus]|uniref:(rape) hypothetical protein n=1 Tax=Brassica napus TaxID=3708 RepID=A0A816JNJ0_BRANA|nr:unnamed protein product [Brassica napus]